jgi:hypothetical protein
VDWAAGNIESAKRHGIEARDVFAAIDDRFMLGWAEYTLGLGDLSEDYTTAGGSPQALTNARARLANALTIFAEAEDISGYTIVIDAIALAALRQGDTQRAARLSGMVARLERATGTGINLWNREVLDFHPEKLRSDPALAESWAAGEALTAAEAVAYALEE